jgi:glycosyltransferase involved in cell wall biosynthesis
MSTLLMNSIPVRSYIHDFVLLLSEKDKIQGWHRAERGETNRWDIYNIRWPRYKYKIYCKLDLKINMKILYIDPFIILDSMGGSQKSLLDIMTEMKTQGHEVLLGTPGAGLLKVEAKNRYIGVIKFFLPDFIDTRITIGTRRIFNIFAAAYDMFILFLSSFSLFFLVQKNKPDIVHANQMLISIAVGIACKLAKIPCVWHIRENPADHISGFVLKVFGLFGFLFSDQIMVNSRYTANTFGNTLLYNKIVVVPIGIENITDHRINECENLRDKKNKFAKIISIFGRIVPRKGHRVLIKSLKIIKEKFQDFELLILGNFDENDSYYLSLLSLIEELELVSNIKFCGFKSDINTILNISDIVVAPSIEPETFGRTLIEAMGARKPIVATLIGAHPEIIEDGITGFLVEPNNPELLADKIEKLLMNNEYAKEMGQRGGERYEKYYTLEKYGKNIVEVYTRFYSRG